MPDMRVWAYCRSSSRSKAGRVPLVDVNLSRASRTAARLHDGYSPAVQSAFHRKLHDFGLFAGLLIKQHKSCPLIARAFALSISGAKIIKSCLKGLKNPVKREVKLTCSAGS